VIYDEIMFSLGFGEIALVCIIALIFIGPEQLPDIARVVGRLINDLKRASSE
jgi:sec-independent protein translocase protein TatB